MTNPMINPNYSGVTIQISNPAVYAGGGNGGNCPIAAQNIPSYNTAPIMNPQLASNSYQSPQAPAQSVQAYPPQYYLNNYNYQGSGEDLSDAKKLIESQDSKSLPQNIQDNTTTNSENKTPTNTFEQNMKDAAPEDMTKSQDIINNLDERDAAAKEEAKNTKQKKVVALTDEYIKSLENYLNNPNDEIRLMASKEILTRLDEDKNRYDDAALNALLNKMLQDPSKLVRIASLSAFSSGLASGNDYTITLLHNIQNNPSADKEDVLQSADILLKMSAGNEVKNIPDPKVKDTTTKGQ